MKTHAIRLLRFSFRFRFALAARIARRLLKLENSLASRHRALSRSSAFAGATADRSAALSGRTGYVFGDAFRRSAELHSISICRNRREPRRILVAQICNLLYRRIAFGQALVRPEAQQITNLRYGRIQFCATLVAAPPRCAVSPICNRQSVRRFQRSRPG